MSKNTIVIHILITVINFTKSKFNFARSVRITSSRCRALNQAVYGPIEWYSFVTVSLRELQKDYKIKWLS